MSQPLAEIDSEGRRKLAAGVVDEKVDPAELGQNGAYRNANHFLFADVTTVAGRAAAGRGDFARDGLELFEPAPDQSHARTQRGKFVGNAAPDARAAAGDDAGASGKQAGTENRFKRGCGWGCHVDRDEAGGLLGESPPVHYDSSIPRPLRPVESPP